MRIGHGFDVHKFGGKGPLIIGGVIIPYSQGLLAHSDGDVALHAIIDALLGAASLGDIGKLFPNTDPEYKNINSRVLLRKAWQLIISQGYCLGNLDITIIAQTPMLSPFFFEIRSYLAKDLTQDINNINIKATTTEYLGFIGNNEGIACEAITLLLKV